MRQIGRVARPGEYAVVHTDTLVQSPPTVKEINESEHLDVANLSVVGDTITIGPDDQSARSVMFDLDVPGEPISSFSYPGVYGLLYVPFEE